MADQVSGVWLWGHSMGPEVGRGLADPDTRRGVARHIRIAKEKEARAVEHLEKEYARRIAFQGECRDDEGYFRSRIVESIRDEGRPVIAFGVIGKKRARPPLGEVYRKALEWALKVVRTPRIRDYHSGLAAYAAWAEALPRDEGFPAHDMAVLRERHMVHSDAVGTVAEGRWYGAQFLKKMAEHQTSVREDLEAAGACYEAEHDLMWKVWDLAGGNGWSDEHVRKLAEPEVRRQIVPVILQARDKDAEAADHVERALAMWG